MYVLGTPQSLYLDSPIIVEMNISVMRVLDSMMGSRVESFRVRTGRNAWGVGHAAGREASAAAQLT